MTRQKAIDLHRQGKIKLHRDCIGRGNYSPVDSKDKEFLNALLYSDSNLAIKVKKETFEFIPIEKLK